MNFHHVSKIVWTAACLAVLTGCGHRPTDTAENSNVYATTSAGISRPADEMIVVGEVPDYGEYDRDLEIMMKLPRPRLMLVSEGAPEQKLGLPEEAEKILDDHWREAIKFFYNDEYVPTGSAQNQGNRDTAWGRFCSATGQALQKVNIEAPGGKRTLSQTEASELWASLNRSAVKLVKKS